MQERALTAPNSAMTATGNEVPRLLKDDQCAHWVGRVTKALGLDVSLLLREDQSAHRAPRATEHLRGKGENFDNQGSIS
jgi:hypothetical protein